MFLSFVGDNSNKIKFSNRDILFIRMSEDLKSTSSNSVAVVVGGNSSQLSFKSGLSDTSGLIIDKPGEFGFEDINISTTAVSGRNIVPRVLTNGGAELFYVFVNDELRLKELVSSTAFDDTAGEARIIILDLSSADLDDTPNIIEGVLGLIKKIDNPKLVIFGSSSMIPTIAESLKKSGIDDLDSRSIDSLKIKKTQDVISLPKISLVY